MAYVAAVPKACSIWLRKDACNCRRVQRIAGRGQFWIDAATAKGGHVVEGEGTDKGKANAKEARQRIDRCSLTVNLMMPRRAH